MSTNTLAHLLNPSSASDDSIIIPGAPTLSYAQYAYEIERTAELLAGAGVKPGRPVSIVLVNNLEFMVLFLAVARAGAVAAPLNPDYTVDEFKFFMEDADAQLAIVPPRTHLGRDAAKELGIPVLEASLDGGSVVLSNGSGTLTKTVDAPAPSPEDVALFLHTSGTTSRPKGVPLTHANLMKSISNIKNHYVLTPEDTSIIVMPLFHVHGLMGASLSTLNSGGSLVIPERFSASNFWGLQKNYSATWYSAVPTIHQILLMRADDDNAPHESFRFIRSCSSALAPAVFEKLEARFGAPVLEAYGMTEASHQMSSSPMPPGKRIPGTVGQATGVEIAIMDMESTGQIQKTGDIGEVVIKGENVMHGYNNNPEANAEAFVDGWFRTGDQGFLDADGYLSLTGRIKELINRGGEKISPLEVDGVLLKHPAVAEAVCFAVPDEKYGEVVHAAVVLSGESDQAEIRSYCREQLADFKVPEVVYISDVLPRTATGKIQRRHMVTAFVDDEN
ncbi:MAG: AMP-dependent synthetase [Chloroflexi bacterium]|nr:AMP-dependent synthetase [Chloroflexota bacterium]|tara:strand:+ start:317 stop:1828 length:1512 start_codon:yes stop_codon:yes gene_type:complete